MISFLGAGFEDVITKAVEGSHLSLHEVESVEITQQPLCIEKDGRRWHSAEITFSVKGGKSFQIHLHGVNAEKGKESTPIPVVLDTDKESAEKELLALRKQMDKLKEKMAVVSGLLEGANA